MLATSDIQELLSRITYKEPIYDPHAEYADRDL